MSKVRKNTPTPNVRSLNLAGITCLLALACSQPKGPVGSDADEHRVAFADVFTMLSSGEHFCTSCHNDNVGAMTGRGGFALATKALPEPSLEALDFMYEAIVGMPASTGHDESACAGQTLVVPRRPEESLLLAKLAGVDMSVCGEQMPLGTSIPLNELELSQLSTWISQGAQR